MFTMMNNARLGVGVEGLSQSELATQKALEFAKTRKQGNAKIDKDDSHPGKIVTQKWYQRNKHIHPYSRWVYYMRS